MGNKSNKQIGRFIYLIPLIIIAISLYITARPHANNETRLLVDSSHNHEHSINNNIGNDSVVVEYKAFDPNRADYRTLISSGVPRKIAVNILKWRESGKVFRIKEDLALCYGMTDSLFFLLEPHITIDEEFAIKHHDDESSDDGGDESHQRHTLRTELTEFSLDSVGEGYLTLLGFTPKQAALVIRYRDMIGGYPTFEKFEECYAVDSIMAARLRPYIIFPTPTNEELDEADTTILIDINGADVETLVMVRGIGQKSAKQIVRYRELLGGYYSVEQISELQTVTEENFLIILPQICCDSSKIKKININFAAQNELETHPYLSSRMLKQIINHRELKGGWSTIEEMIEDKIFTQEEAARIAPYLLFGTNPE